MSKEPWEQAEDDFDDHWTRLGKKACLFEFRDARKLHGMNKKRVATGKQPSDRLVTYNGVTFYAEVKYTTDPVRFSFGLMKPGQHGHALRTILAGGEYRVYVKSAHTGLWYCIPYEVIRNHTAKSLTWAELAPFITTI